MQPAYSPPVSLTSPVKLNRRANLASLMTGPSAIINPTDLARAMGKPKMRSHLSNVASGLKGMGDTLAATIESALGLPSGWMDQQHPNAGEGAAQYRVAQNMSQGLVSHDLPMMSWEDLVKRPIPEVFRTILPDDALAPDHPAGTEIVWTTRRRPAPGRLLLVQDRHGQIHARQCHQGRAPGQWIAAPISPAYVAFDSHEEGLQLLAVFKGRLEPDD